MSSGRRRRVRQRNLAHEEEHPEFAFVAGFTSWGFPYGITWEELEGRDVEPWTDVTRHRPDSPLPEDDVPY